MMALLCFKLDFSFWDQKYAVTFKAQELIDQFQFGVIQFVLSGRISFDKRLGTRPKPSFLAAMLETFGLVCDTFDTLWLTWHQDVCECAYPLATNSHGSNWQRPPLGRHGWKMR